MRTKSLVLIIIALGCGLVASIGISEVLKQKPVGEGVVETEPILVAAIDIDIGKKLDAANVKIEQWPKGKVPVGALHSLEEVQDDYTRTRLYSGEPILLAKLMNTKDPGAAPKIPEGYVAIPVRVELDTVIGLIQPGDLVDVMVFLRQGPDVPRTGSYTILRLARVFAVNSQTDRTTDEKGQEIAARTVSLLVKPKQGEKLTLATELGKIRLALRRPSDEVSDDEQLNRDLPAIFRDVDLVANEKQEVRASEPETSVAPLPAFPMPLVATEPAVVVSPVPVAAAPVWTMRVMSPNDVRQFDWSSGGELPQESSPLGGDSSRAVVPPADFAPEPATEGTEEATTDPAPEVEAPIAS
jgi:pilus assembly protein CpaB